jgi:hypothetical protein
MLDGGEYKTSIDFDEGMQRAVCVKPEKSYMQAKEVAERRKQSTESRPQKLNCPLFLWRQWVFGIICPEKSCNHVIMALLLNYCGKAKEHPANKNPDHFDQPTVGGSIGNLCFFRIVWEEFFGSCRTTHSKGDSGFAEGRSFFLKTGKLICDR